jgi:hypothetical protein
VSALPSRPKGSRPTAPGSGLANGYGANSESRQVVTGPLALSREIAATSWSLYSNAAMRGTRYGDITQLGSFVAMILNVSKENSTTTGKKA